MTKTHTIRNLGEMKAFAADLVARLSSRHILLLDGPMGAGKTQLTRFMVDALGGDEAVSPSFAIHNQYETSRGAIDHVDLYRLENEEELESTGFWDLFSSAQGLIIIEWAERLPRNSLPVSWKKTQLRLQILSADSRQITEED